MVTVRADGAPVMSAKRHKIHYMVYPKKLLKTLLLPMHNQCSLVLNNFNCVRVFLGRVHRHPP